LICISYMSHAPVGTFASAFVVSATWCPRYPTRKNEDAEGARHIEVDAKSIQ
jgi:hypothetical protein